MQRKAPCCCPPARVAGLHACPPRCPGQPTAARQRHRHQSVRRRSTLQRRQRLAHPTGKERPARLCKRNCGIRHCISGRVHALLLLCCRGRCWDGLGAVAAALIATARACNNGACGPDGHQTLQDMALYNCAAACTVPQQNWQATHPRTARFELQGAQPSATGRPAGGVGGRLRLGRRGRRRGRWWRHRHGACIDPRRQEQARCPRQHCALRGPLPHALLCGGIPVVFATGDRVGDWHPAGEQVGGFAGCPRLCSGGSVGIGGSLCLCLRLGLAGIIKLVPCALRVLACMVRNVELHILLHQLLQARGLRMWQPREAGGATCCSGGARGMPVGWPSTQSSCLERRRQTRCHHGLRTT